MAQLNQGTHIVTLMGRQDCTKHRAPKGFPCYEIYTGPGATKVLPGICNRRAVLAGANGKISASSYTTRSTRREKPKAA